MNRCQNCGWTGPDKKLFSQFPDIEGLGERVQPGEPCPSGECPKCRALCQVVEEGPASTKHPIQVALETEGYKCRAYSGRGMMGKYCLGVTIEGNILRIKTVLPDEEDMLFGNAHKDSMGLKTIYYWPSVPYVEEVEAPDPSPGKMISALKVICLDKKIRAWLVENDPKALKQAEDAIEGRLCDRKIAKGLVKHSAHMGECRGPV